MRAADETLKLTFFTVWVYTFCMSAGSGCQVIYFGGMERGKQMKGGREEKKKGKYKLGHSNIGTPSKSPLTSLYVIIINC